VRPLHQNNASVNELSRRSNHHAPAFRSRHPGAQQRQVIMEIAAVVMFGSVVLWLLDEASSARG